MDEAEGIWRRRTWELRPCRWVSEIMALLKTSERTDILTLLADGPMCVSALANALFLPIASVSTHLAHLDRRGLVAATRVKNYHIYSLTERVGVARPQFPT